MLDSKFDLNQRYKIQLPSLLSVFIILSIGLAVGYLGPFGSYQMPLPSRLAYWLILIGVGRAIFALIDKVCHYYLDENKTSPWFTLFISSLVGAFFLSFFVEFVSHYFIQLAFNFPNNFLFFFPKVFILSLILNIFGYFLDKATKNDSKPQTEPKIENHFIKRIPKNLGDELICFCMEDHYLHLYTSRGDCMLLLRMKDALLELQDYPGFQVHRSWWVALDAIADVKKQTRKATLIMKNGMQVPVSQKYLSTLKQKGLI